VREPFGVVVTDERVQVWGEVDLATAPQLQDAILRLSGFEHTKVIVDLAEVTFLDSTGLSVFVRARRRFNDLGAALEITNVPKNISQVFRMAGMTEYLDLPTPHDLTTS
jgi:anti-sigma B factor antagonist